jgi:hypothetical protein
LCSYHYLFGCFQHFLVHKLHHLPTISISLVFFCCFLELLKIQTMTLIKTHILTWDNPTTTNVKQWQIGLPCDLSFLQSRSLHVGQLFHKIN